jgi:hypothetical protein
MNETLTTSIGDLTGLTTERIRELQREASAGPPSRPLFGVLPLRRAIPQDVHSVLDYAGGASLVLAGILAGDSIARTAGIGLGAAMIGTSLVTDYRLSLAKIVPIETHELGDYVIGFAAMAVPLLPRRKGRGRLTSWLQFAVGASTVLASLFTDYRATGTR